MSVSVIFISKFAKNWHFAFYKHFEKDYLKPLK